MLTIEMDNFDLGQICRSGQCFRMDQIGDDRYRVIAGDKYLELTQERGIVNFFCPEEDFIFFWIRYFDLDCDYSEYINMINPRDKYLTAAGEMGSGIRILQLNGHKDFTESDNDQIIDSSIQSFFFVEK